MDFFAAPVPTPLLQQGEVIAHIWIVQHMIGSGWEGQIFSAKCATAPYTNVAIKILIRTSANNLQMEHDIYVNMRARLPENYFPRVYFQGNHEDKPIMVMDLLGISMHDAHSAASPPSPRTLLQWIRQLLQQIWTLHTLGLVHRDVHADNVMIGRADTELVECAVLIDFGMARKQHRDDQGNIGKKVSQRKADLDAVLKMFPIHIERMQGDEWKESVISSILDKLRNASQFVESITDNYELDYDEITRYFI